MVTPERPCLREAVARFDDAARLEEAVSALQSHGFQRADISFVAREGFLGAEPATGPRSADAVARDPRAKHAAPVESTDVRQGRVLGTSLAACVAAFAAAGFTVATGGAAALAIGLAAAAGLGVGAAGAALGKQAGESAQHFIDAQVAHGGVLVWVRTFDTAAEQRALDILHEQGGFEVRLQDVPATSV